MRDRPGLLLDKRYQMWYTLYMINKAKISIILVLIVLGIMSTTAHAATMPEIQEDYQLALEYYKISSPPQCETVRITILPADPAGSLSPAEATQPEPGDYFSFCELNIFEAAFDDMGSGCAKRLVLKHEVGHLIGLGHSTDPNSIMNGEKPPIGYWCPDEIEKEQEVRWWKHVVQKWRQNHHRHRRERREIREARQRANPNYRHQGESV